MTRNLKRHEFMAIVARIGSQARNQPKGTKTIGEEIERWKHTTVGAPVPENIEVLIAKANEAGLSMRCSDSVRYHFLDAVRSIANSESSAKQAIAVKAAWDVYDDAGKPGQVL